MVERQFYELRIFKANIPRILELLQSQKDIYSEIIYKEIKNQLEKQGYKNGI